MAYISNLVYHYANDLQFKDDLPIEEVEKLIKAKGMTIPLTKLKISWECEGVTIRMDMLNPTVGKYPLYITPLSDLSGFICFEESWKANNNCLLLNAFGLERMRLTVPVELTKRDIPKTNQMCFLGITSPWTEFGGKFGVHAWIEGSGSGGYLEGDWYFELDYHTGQFLWGREMRN